MTRKDLGLLALIGFGIWLSGAVTFRFAGALMFESGLPILLAVAASVALTVCLLLRSIMGWRKVPADQAVAAAVALIVPGLFGDVAYILNFTAFTGLAPVTAGPYAAVMIFGTAALLAYAVFLAQQARPAAT